MDDDVVVQHDLTPLWELDLNGQVNGAVGMWGGDGESSYCLARTFGEYLNFSNSIISSEFEPDQCAWLYGMNVFDLQAWRRTNITQTYHSWLKHVSTPKRYIITVCLLLTKIYRACLFVGVFY